MKSRTQGFTLTELMIVVGLAATIVAIGAPNFQQFRLNNRLSNAANDLLSVVTTARTEAIKRQRNIAACAADAPASDAATCAPASTQGWIAFDDANGNCVRDAGEMLVTSRTFDTSITSNPLRVRADGTCLQFGATGFRQKVAALVPVNHVTICDDRGLATQTGLNISAGRGLLITTTGRARISRTVGDGSLDDLTGDAWKDVKCPS